MDDARLKQIRDWHSNGGDTLGHALVGELLAEIDRLAPQRLAASAAASGVAVAAGAASIAVDKPKPKVPRRKPKDE